jgi:transposase
VIEANEFYIVNELKDIGLDNKHIRQILKRFGGWRIYFRKKKSEYEEIRELYKQMKLKGMKRSKAVKILATLFDKSENRIRIITKEQKGLFDEY